MCLSLFPHVRLCVSRTPRRQQLDAGFKNKQEQQPPKKKKQYLYHIHTHTVYEKPTKTCERGVCNGMLEKRAVTKNLTRLKK